MAQDETGLVSLAIAGWPALLPWSPTLSPGPTWTSDVEAIAKLIATFLELHRLESPAELSQSSDSEADDPGNQS